MHIRRRKFAMAFGMMAWCLALISMRALGFDDVTQTTPKQAMPENVRYVTSPRIMLWYNLAADSEPVTRVELWFTKDRGKTWLQADLHDTVSSPVAFDAASDGLYGFFLILHNEAGASSPPPHADEAPQQWVRVDRSVPNVQLLAVRPDPRFEVNREIHLRWSATDDNMPDRPVSLHYRTAETKAYQLIADCLSPKSAYRWVVPAGVTGRVEIKISAADRAGNIGTYVVDTIRIDGGKKAEVGGQDGKNTEAAKPAAVRHDVMSDGTVFRKASLDEPDAGADVGAHAAQIEAKRRYEAGTYNRLRGEYQLAIARFNEAIELDPKLLAARCDLAGVMLLTGEMEKADQELHRVLKEDPAYRPAMRGLALVQVRRKNYQSARETLDKLLLLEPRDAEAWLAYGDVMLFTGSRRAARDAWGKADKYADGTNDLKNRASKRLELYSEGSPAVVP